MQAGCRDSRPAVGRQDFLDGSDHLVSARRTIATTGSTAARGFVAVDDGKLVGFVAGHRTRRFDYDGELQWINVAEERRGQGIADKLMAQIGAWFIEQEVLRVCVNVNPENITARRLYARCGARPLNEHWMGWDDAQVVRANATQPAIK